MQNTRKDQMMLNKKVTACLAAAAIAACLALVGCGGSQAASSEAASADAAASSAAASAEASAPEAEAPASSEAASSAAAEAPAATASPAAATTSDYIGDDAAIAAALQHAGIAQADATELESELDTDDAVVHYDVDFKSGGLEYSYDIDAVTGDVLSYESEVDD